MEIIWTILIPSLIALFAFGMALAVGIGKIESNYRVEFTAAFMIMGCLGSLASGLVYEDKQEKNALEERLEENQEELINVTEKPVEELVLEDKKGPFVTVHYEMVAENGWKKKSSITLDEAELSDYEEDADYVLVEKEWKEDVKEEIKETLGEIESEKWNESLKSELKKVEELE